MHAFISAAIAGATLLFTGPVALAATEPAAADARDHRWSTPVNGLQARIELRRVQVINGTPILATYLYLRNVSDVMNPMTVRLSEKLVAYHVVDAKGNDVRQTNGAFDGPMLGGDIDLVLPVRGELSFDYSSHGAGIAGDKAAHIDLGPDMNWAIDRTQGDCFLHAVLEVAKPATLSTGVTRPWHGRIELPAVKIPVGAEPIDNATVEARINELGEKMLSKENQQRDAAMQQLSRIDDPRCIPWYLKALNTSDYELKFNALDRLAQFNSDEALAGLQKGTSTKGVDIGSASTPAVAADMANNIRHAACAGLGRSKHPGAAAVLISMADDPYHGVRIDVIHALAKMDTLESLALLKKMGSDANESVRDEARRCLQEREAKKKDPK